MQTQLGEACILLMCSQHCLIQLACMHHESLLKSPLRAWPAVIGVVKAQLVRLG